MNWRWRTDLWVFLVCAASLLAGAVCWLLGARGLAAGVWAGGCLPALATLLHGAVTALRRRETGVDVLALISIGGALLLRQELTAAMIALMLASGRLLEGFAARRAGRELTALLARAPRHAQCYRDGVLVELPPEQIQVADRLLVRRGDILATDGTALADNVELDESALTGEPMPVTHHRGSALRSGSVNAGDAFEMVATASASDSTYAGIVKLVEAAQQASAPSTRLADRYAAWFVPLSLGVAGFAWLLSGSALRALAVVVVATPCPLLLAVPVAMVSAISRCARRGILVKGGAALEALANAHTLFLDKTGTLTGGQARLVGIDNAGLLDDDELLRSSASLEQLSHHVMAQAVVDAARARQIPLGVPDAVSESPGAGLRGTLDGHSLAVGSRDYVANLTTVPPSALDRLERGSLDGIAPVLIALDGRYAGALLLADPIRAETPRALRLLRRAGLRRIVMLTGDRRDAAEATAAGLGIDAVLASQTPSDKLAAIERAHADGTTVMVGDGINDAPALAAATIGVAMGARGATASAEAADIVLLVDRLDRLAEAMHIARRTRRIAMQSALAGMGLSLLAMLLASLGLLAPLYGALLQEIIDVAVILNALRVLRIRPPRAVRHRLDHRQAEHLRTEHQQLAPLLNRLGAAITHLSGMTTGERLLELEAIDRGLREQLLPHESTDDREVYPAIAELLGGDDPMATLSHTHREIFRLHRLFSADLAHLRAAPDDNETRHRLQRHLHALDAILRLHFAQEEEIYQSVIDD